MSELSFSHTTRRSRASLAVHALFDAVLSQPLFHFLFILNFFNCYIYFFIFTFLLQFRYTVSMHFCSYKRVRNEACCSWDDTSSSEPRIRNLAYLAARTSDARRENRPSFLASRWYEWKPLFDRADPVNRSARFSLLCFSFCLCVLLFFIVASERRQVLNRGCGWTGIL